MKKLFVIFVALVASVNLFAQESKSVKNYDPMIAMEQMYGDVRIALPGNECELFWSQDQGVFYILNKGIKKVHVLQGDGSFIIEEHEESWVENAFDLETAWKHDEEFIVRGGGEAWKARWTELGEDYLWEINYPLTLSPMTTVADILVTQGKIDIHIFRINFVEKERELIFKQQWTLE